jgi:hypothetical protein
MKTKKLEIDLPKWLYDIVVMQAKIRKTKPNTIVSNAIMIYLAEQVLDEL